MLTTAGAWRMELPVPDGEGGSTDDDDDDYDSTDYPDAYEIAWKLREANARLLADSSPVHSNRPRRVQFSDPIRDVLCFTPDEHSGSSEAEEEEPEDDLGGTESPPCDGTSRLVTAAAVERRGSLTKEELPLTPAAAGGMSASDDVTQDLQLGDNSDEDVEDRESFESDDTSVSENISESSGDKDKNHITEAGVPDAGDDDDGSHSSGKSSGSVDASRSTPDGSEYNVTAQRVRESTGGSCSDGGGGRDSPGEERPQVAKHATAEESAKDAASSTTAPVAASDSGPNSESCNHHPAATLVRKPVTALPRNGEKRSSARHSAALWAAYGGAKPGAKTVGAVAVRHDAAPPNAGWETSVRPASVPIQRRQQTGHWNNGARQEAPGRPERAVHSARQVARPSDKMPHGASSSRKSPWKTNSEKREPPGRSPPLSFGTAAKRAATPNGGFHSTYALPKELKEELVRRKRRERELRQEREAREADERRQRLLEAEQAFRAWVATKSCQKRGSRMKASSARDTEGESSSSEQYTAVPEQRRHQDAAFEAWVRRKRRQQREEELRRRLRDIELGATDRPRPSRHEAQLVYRAWLERKWEEERERRLAARAQRRGLREAALSSQSLRLLERYLGSDEFARYPELVL
ncbi:uncharacterized protein LOC144152050 [Haemaphysalis longicornis]